MARYGDHPLGRRISKTVGGATTDYLYATESPNSILGTPQVTVDHGGQLSWKGLSEAFGETRVVVGAGAAMKGGSPARFRF